MSRIGNNTISIANDVSIKIEGKNLEVKGKNGSQSLLVHDNINIDLKDSVLNFSRVDDSAISRSMHGTTRQIVNNMIIGVTEGFKKELEIIGVGYNAKSQNNRVVLQLGFSHDIIFDLPEGIEAIADGKKGDKLEIKGINKQIVGQVAAKIRSLRKPEPYKGKGIRYKDEYVRSKQGKTVGGGE